MANFWRAFHHDGKVSPAWLGGWGVHAHLLSPNLPSRRYKVVVYSPAEKEDRLPLFLLYPNMYSVSATLTDVVHDTIYKYSSYKFSLCTLYKIMTDIFPLFLSPPVGDL
jgi:hypothetical protein